MVLWNNVFSDDSNLDATIDFVEKNLDMRTWKRQLDDVGRAEVNKASVKKTDHYRTIARKALRRRNVSYSLVG